MHQFTMNNRQIARRVIARLTDPAARLEPALLIEGREYTAAQLASLDAGALWGEAMGKYAAGFVACIQRQRHKPAPRPVYVIRDETDLPAGTYPVDLMVLEATGWQVTEIIVTYPPGNPKIATETRPAYD